MSRVLWRSLKLNGLLLLALVATTVPAKVFAQETAPTNEAKPQSGCLSGYPDGTFRGDQPVTRNEFAAGMNECLEQVDRQLPFNRANLATREDMQALIERQRELNASLRQLSDRVGGMTEKSVVPKKSINANSIRRSINGR
jgi:hypothetical protein